MSTDTTALSPDELEQLAKAYFTSKRSYSLIPLLVGEGLDMLLCGMMIAMMVHWASVNRDHTRMRVLVWWVFVAELGHSAYTFGSIIQWFGVGNGTYLQFLSPTWYVWHGLFAALVVPPVLIFYFLRAYRLERKCIWLLLVLVPLLLAWLTGCLGVLVVSLVKDYTDLMLGIGLYLTRVVDATTLGLDLVITGGMTFVLFRSRTGWSETDKLVNRLIFITVETLLPSTLLAAAGIISSFAATESFLLVLYSMVYSKSIAITFLALLLGRRGLRERFIAPATTLPPTVALQNSPPVVSYEDVSGGWNTKDSEMSRSVAPGSPREIDDLRTPRDEVYSLHYGDTLSGARKEHAEMELAYASVGRLSSPSPRMSA